MDGRGARLDLLDEEYRALGILPTDLYMHVADDYFYVGAPALGGFGKGPTLTDALDDLSRDVRHFYEFLDGHSGLLTSEMTRTLSDLRAKVVV